MKDHIYEGSYVYGNKCGHGKKYYSWGDVYEGNWHNDLQNGYGSMIYANGNQYSGNWNNGNMSGYGVMKYSNGSMYEGSFNNGFKEGYGKYVDVLKKYEYEGFFKADNMCGIGKIVYENGDIYDGEMKDNVKNGKGVMICKERNINKVEGEWKDDKIEGVCSVIMNNGDRFIGYWDDYNGDITSGPNKDHPPTIIYKNGDIYVGEIIDMVPNGIGIMNYTLCNQKFEMYKGRWMNCKYNGYGELLYKNGTKYVGEWVDDKMYGKGKIIYSNGDIYYGEWENGYYVNKGEYVSKENETIIKYIHKEDGDVMIYDEDRLVYEGNHNNLIRHGYGKEIDKDGCIYEGKWKDGIRDTGNITLPNSNNSYLCIYKNDKLKPVKMLDIPKSEINLLKEYLNVKRQRDEIEDCVEVVTKKYKKSLNVVENILINVKNNYNKSLKILNNLSGFIHDKQSKDSDGIPYILTCPLTLELMKDPVICSDGNTYEKEAIRTHLTKKSTSPLNRQVMDRNVMIPNQSVKSFIDIWKNIKECNENSKFFDVPQMFHKIGESSGRGRGMSMRPVESSGRGRGMSMRPVESSVSSGRGRGISMRPVESSVSSGRGRGMSMRPVESSVSTSGRGRGMSMRPVESSVSTSGRGRGMSMRPVESSVSTSGRGVDVRSTESFIPIERNELQLLIDQNNNGMIESEGNELLEYVRMIENEDTNFWFQLDT